MVTKEAVKIRIYTTESRSFEGKILYKSAAHRLNEAGAQGVSVFRAVYGLGRFGEHGTHIADIMENLPMVIESVSSKDIIEKFIGENVSMLRLCTVCIEPALMLEL